MNVRHHPGSLPRAVDQRRPLLFRTSAHISKYGTRGWWLDASGYFGAEDPAPLLDGVSDLNLGLHRRDVRGRLAVISQESGLTGTHLLTAHRRALARPTRTGHLPDGF